ncbi:hypothetical protein [Desulfovibrio sp. 1188_IL3213]|uniref:hypothetical protein n=1 Tax=unclassified Desulfovibrio TaxID=2593640 RepID=UPI003FA57B7E
MLNPPAGQHARRTGQTAKDVCLTPIQSIWAVFYLRWLTTTPPNTNTDAKHCSTVRRSPRMIMPKISVNTGIRFINMLALAAGMRLMLKLEQLTNEMS